MVLIHGTTWPLPYRNMGCSDWPASPRNPKISLFRRFPTQGRAHCIFQQRWDYCCGCLSRCTDAYNIFVFTAGMRRDLTGFEMVTERVGISFDSSKLAVIMLMWRETFLPMQDLFVWDLPSGTLLHSLGCDFTPVFQWSSICPLRTFP